MSRYADAFDEAYKEHYSPADAVADLRILDGLAGPDDLALTLSRPRTATIRSTQIEGVQRQHHQPVPSVAGTAAPGSRRAGRAAVRGHPHRRDRLPHLRFRPALLGGTTCRTTCSPRTTRTALRRGVHPQLARVTAAVDGFNRLVLAAGLDWRQVAVLRAYTHYLRQLGTPYTQRYLERVLVGQRRTSPGCCSTLFGRRFDPARRAGNPGARTADDARPTGGHRPSTRSPASTPTVSCGSILSMILGHRPVPTSTRRTTAGSIGPYLAFKLDPGPGSRCAGTRSRARDLGVLAASGRGAPPIRRGRPRAACVGRTDPRTSAPRSSAWSRPRR